MGVHMTQTRKAKKSMRQRETGVSLLELMITLGIGMVLVAMATPLVNTTINIYRLRGAGSDYANLLQQTRMRAVSNDRYYPVYASTTAGTVAGWAGFNAFADINLQGGATGAYAVAPLGPDLGVAFNHSSIILRRRGAAPALVNLENGYMPGVNPIAVAINPNDNWATPGVTVVSFGPRGLPCYLAAAPPAGGGGNCSYTFPAAGVPQPVAFETFMQNIRTGAWEAITINPSGRIREWRYNASNATWQPLN
jgi:Tfp pilus assembly protein FimT